MIKSIDCTYTFHNSVNKQKRKKGKVFFFSFSFLPKKFNWISANCNPYQVSEILKKSSTQNVHDYRRQSKYFLRRWQNVCFYDEISEYHLKFTAYSSKYAYTMLKKL